METINLNEKENGFDICVKVNSYDKKEKTFVCEYNNGVKVSVKGYEDEIKTFMKSLVSEFTVLLLSKTENGLQIQTAYF